MLGLGAAVEQSADHLLQGVAESPFLGVKTGEETSLQMPLPPGFKASDIRGGSLHEECQLNLLS